MQTGDQLGVGDTVFEFREEAALLPDWPLLVGEQETVARVLLQPPAPESNRLSEERTKSSAPSRDLALVGKIGKLLNSAYSAEQLAGQMLEAFGHSVPAERAAVFLLQRGEWAVYGWNQREGLCPAPFARREIVDQVFQHGKPLLAQVESAPASATARSLRTTGGPPCWQCRCWFGMRLAACCIWNAAQLAP